MPRTFLPIVTRYSILTYEKISMVEYAVGPTVKAVLPFRKKRT